MPRTYPPEAKQKAYELYLSGITLEEVSKRMRLDHGFATYNVETLRRWVEEGGWEGARDKLRAKEKNLTLELSIEALEAAQLQDLLDWKKTVDEKLNDQNEKDNFHDNMNLQVKIHGLISRAIQRRNSNAVGRVDKAALAAEVLTLVVKALAKADPASMEIVQPHITDIGRMLKERYAETG